MDTKTREFELDYLKKVIGYVSNETKTTLARKAKLDEHIDEMLKAYNDENTELFMQLVLETDLQKDAEKLLHVYKNAVKSPYFGRVDFAEHGEPPLPVYIGRGGIIDKNHVLVADWRTPVANLYYDCEPGQASYTSPDGEISVDLSLKRTYDIEDGQLVDYYDADLVTNDELLQEYLAKNTDVVLKDIVATIQADQNEIIRAEPWHNVIVQGVAGSGKSTVALHRLSWLVFNQPAKENRYLIIGTNRMFLNYVSGMLPDLGVESIRQMVMRELVSYLLYYNDPKTAPQEDFKASLNFTRELDSFISDFEQQVFLSEDVTLDGQIILSVNEVAENFELRARVPMMERAENLANLIAYRVKTRLGGILNKIELKADDELAAAVTREERADIIDRKYAHMESVKKASKKLKRFYTGRIKRIKEKKFYLSFLDSLKESSEGDILDAIKRTQRNIRKNAFDLYDLCSLALISCRMQNNERAAEFDHIMVDEAQDFGPMAFSFLTQVFPSARFTILGDLAQNIHSGAGLSSWDEITPMFPSLFFRKLTKSYRNTIEIADLANKVLERLGVGYEITPVVRHGREPVFYPAADFGEAVKSIRAAIENTTRSRGSTAIICRDGETAGRVHESLGISSQLIGEDTERYEGGVIVAPVTAVKGLEFDRVVVFGAGKKEYPADPHSARLLYVALTRALHELSVVHIGEISPLIK